MTSPLPAVVPDVLLGWRVKMDDDEMRRLILNVNTAALLAGTDQPGPRDVNRAVQTARDIDKAVRKRLRWEARRQGGREDDGVG